MGFIKRIKNPVAICDRVARIMSRLPGHETAIFVKVNAQAVIQRISQHFGDQPVFRCINLKNFIMGNTKGSVNRENMPCFISDADSKEVPGVSCCVLRQDNSHGLSDKVAGFDADSIARQIELNVARERTLRRGR